MLCPAKGIVPKNKSNEVAIQPIIKNNTKVLNPRNTISINKKIMPIAKKISVNKLAESQRIRSYQFEDLASAAL